MLAELARWTLLAQIDTDDRAGMMWGDCGALYWLSRRQEMTAIHLAPTSFTWQWDRVSGYHGKGLDTL